MIKSREGVVACKLEDGLALLNPVTAKYFTLNKSGMEVWSLVERGSILPEIVSHLLDRYDVDEAACRRDVVRLITALGEAQLIHVVDEDVR